MSLREKLLSTEFDAWNERPSALTGGILGGLGGLLGSTMFQTFEKPYPRW